MYKLVLGAFVSLLFVLTPATAARADSHAKVSKAKKSHVGKHRGHVVRRTS